MADPRRPVRPDEVDGHRRRRRARELDGSARLPRPARSRADARGGLSRPRRGDGADGRAAALPQPARPPDPPQRPRWLRGPVRAAGGRAVLPAAAGLAPRGRGSCSPTRRSIEAQRRAGAARRSSPCWAGARPAELDVLDDGNAWTYWSRSDAFTMALDLGANPRSREGLARVDRGLDRAISSTSRHGRAGGDGSRTGTGAGSSASTPRRRGSATRSGRARTVEADAAGAGARAVPARLRAGRAGGAAGGRPSGLSAPRHDAGPDRADEAPEPRRRPAARRPGAGGLRRPCATRTTSRSAWSSRAGALRARGRSQAWLARRRAAGRARPAGRDAARPSRRRRDLLRRRRRRSSLYAQATGHYRDNLTAGAALALGGAAADRRRGRARRRDGRSLRGRGAGGEHRRHRRGGARCRPTCGRGSRPSSRRSTSSAASSSGSATGPTPRRSAAARPGPAGRGG